MKWEVEGVHKETGATESFVIEAADQQAALAAASDRGCFVSKMRAVPDRTGKIPSARTPGPRPRPEQVPSDFWPWNRANVRVVDEVFKNATLIRADPQVPVPVLINRRSHNELMVTIALGIVLGHVLTALVAAVIFCSGILGVFGMAGGGG